MTDEAIPLISKRALNYAGIARPARRAAMADGLRRASSQ